MIIPIKQIILNEVTLGQLEKANKRFGKNIPKYKKQFLDLKPNSSIAKMVNDEGVKNIGAITVPKRSDLDKNFLSKSFSKQGLNMIINYKIQEYILKVINLMHSKILQKNETMIH
jgi:thiamine pyrophosphate-dependent acetolactate synthase large subunit-like protein